MLASWGHYPKAEAQEVGRITDRRAALPLAPSMNHLPYGNGRSYGDVCLNEGGVLFDMRGLERFIAFDPVTGVLSCEAGVLLGEISKVTLPRGWFLPVTPGTKFVTLGGAVANDVHGKNHHRYGSFGNHVLSFELLRSDGARLLCSPEENADLFAATIGGLGLTGVVTQVSLQLRPVASPFIAGQSIKFGNLDEFFHLSAQSDANYEYTVAWVDCLSSGKDLGRGHFMRGNHTFRHGRLPRSSSLGMPFTPPFSLVNGLSLKPFNAAYFHRQITPVAERLWHNDAFFYPLDGIRNWNRLYGPKGFLQFQCVIPRAQQRDGIAALLREISRSKLGSFLSVLKLFGDKVSPGLMSFPMPGASLALDFPIAGPQTFALLDRLDAIVSDTGGRLYPAKDARMSPDFFQKSFPNNERFRAFIDPKFSSSFWRRVMRKSL
jgi:FAD/FMN-containing dehydrogenase